MMPRLLALIIVFGLAARTGVLAQENSAVIAGRVADETGAALPGALVEARTSNGAIASTAWTASTGTYRLENLSPGAYTVNVAIPNFATTRRADVSLASGETKQIDMVMVLRISADVTVTGKRTFSNLADVETGDHDLIGVADSATEGVFTGRQIDARPIMRTGEVLEAVPGLVISQHSGEGKANQYYLRGFNLDHGTDFATTVAGVPVNMPTHAHGHGYADLSFLIPELVSAVQFRKGPYSAEEGDFSTAGAAHIRYVNTLDRPIARVSGGEDGWARFVLGVSPKVGEGHLLLAADLGHNDGPWTRPDNFEKINGVIRYSRGDTRNAFSITGMGYSVTWDGTDQVPSRAVDQGAIGRFDGIDNTVGGRSARFSLSTDWQRTTTAGVSRATAYALRSRLNLFSNFTYFLDDPELGDQFEQADRRTVAGGRLTHRRVLRGGGRPAELLVGAELRRDAIGTIGLYRTARRARRSTVREDEVGQTSLGLFGQYETQWTPWLRTNVGLRGDVYRFAVAAGIPENGGTVADGLISPKATVILGPWRRTELYVNAGTGFHSNDARGATIAVDPTTGEPADRVTPLVRAKGAEVGLRTVLRPGLHTTVAWWQLDLDSELRFVGDAGTTEAGRPSRRYGIEWSAFYTVLPWLVVDADLAWTHGRFRDEDAVGNRIPGTVSWVAAAGATLEGQGPLFGSVRVRSFGPRELTEEGSVRAAPTRLLNAQLGVGVSRHARLVLDAFNLFDSKASDIDYFYTSRLPNEPEGGVDDIHSHPSLPRSFRVGVQWMF
jgi:hypothetical protein